MASPTARETVLIKYLNEAFGKEKQLETVLQAQIGRTQNKVIKKRFQEHLKETKAQARGLQSRIRALGGKASAGDLPGPDSVSGAVTSVANKAMAAAKGPVQALRGTGAADNELRNIRDSFWNEAEEIAHYNVIEAVADKLGDKETVKLAKEFRRQEERNPQSSSRSTRSRSSSSRSASSRGTASRSSGSRSSGSRSSSSKSSSSRSSSSRSGGSSRSRSTTKRASSSSNGRTTSRSRSSSKS